MSFLKILGRENEMARAARLEKTLDVDASSEAGKELAGRIHDRVRDLYVILDGVLGQADFTSSVLATTQNGMSSPYAVCVDSANSRLFVADAGNSRVLQFNASGTLPVALSEFGVE